MMAPKTDVESRRKAQIIQATRDVVCEKGLDRTTMRDVGSRAGMSAAIVCYYFDDKRRLMKEMLIDSCAAHRATLTAIIERDESPVRKLDLLIEDSFPGTEEQRRDWRFWLEYGAEAARDDELRAFSVEPVVRFRRHIERIIREGAATGVFRKDVAPAVLAEELACLIDGMGAAAMLDPGRISVEMVKAAALRHARPC